VPRSSAHSCTLQHYTATAMLTALRATDHCHTPPPHVPTRRHTRPPDVHVKAPRARARSPKMQAIPQRALRPFQPSYTCTTSVPHTCTRARRPRSAALSTAPRPLGTRPASERRHSLPSHPPNPPTHTQHPHSHPHPHTVHPRCAHTALTTRAAAAGASAARRRPFASCRLGRPAGAALGRRSRACGVWAPPRPSTWPFARGSPWDYS